jgi:putative membrane-bound dehydrogenase-like protein
MGQAADAPAKAEKVKSPFTPQQALKHFHLPSGLRIELVACEPQIESPVAAAFDENGKLWVVEMRDYPNGPLKGQPPLGRVKVLEDKDGDGFYETSTVFADKLLFANGLMPWKGGVIVTAAPHILYLKPDGTKEVLYEGFATENPQLRVSHPELGLDNWIYVANGLRGGKVVRSGKADAKPINISGMDFRFDLIGDREEPVTGMGQYGNTFDDWGNRFVCTNRNHIISIILPNKYVQRNPYLAPPEPMRDNQGPGGAAKVYPLSTNFTTASAHAGEFTSSCSVTIYRGNLLPKEYQGAAFTCEPAGNLLHAEKVIPDGAGFRFEPLFDKKEFLASPDDWFRPVNLFHGPDGALYVVDMYRAVIEHPDWMPPELKKRPDLLLGQDKGRIWRIVPEKHVHKPANKVEVDRALTDANVWQRTTGHRLLLQGGSPPDMRNALMEYCRSDKQPLARVHAAWLLDNLGALTPELIHKMLRAEQPRVREHGILLGERYMPKSEAMQKRVAQLASDPDARVRFQAALTLGEWDDDQILAPLAKIALAGVDDKWTRAAVATALAKRAGALILTLLQMEHGLTEQATASHFTLLNELTVLVGSRSDPAEVADVLEALGKLPAKDAVSWQIAGLNGLAEGMGRRGKQLGVFLKTLPENRRGAAEQAARLLGQAATVALDAKREPGDRISSVRLLAHASWEQAQPVLVKLFDDPVQDVRLVAIRSLAAHPQKEVPAILMKTWSSYTPAVRREVLEAMLRQPDRIQFLLGEVEAGRIKPSDIDPQRSRQLVKHGQADIRERALKLLKGNLPADRKEVLDRYQAALKLSGDTRRGQAVFQKNCATCHRIAGVGHEVGPNIADTLGKTPEQLLVDVLDPNAAIDANYINYTVTTKSGKVLTGIIAAETASSVTLRRAENQSDVVLRQDIEEIQSTGQSLMPEGVEKTISLQEMADLLHFLKHWRFLDDKR